jgi:hypothetical protein
MADLSVLDQCHQVVYSSSGQPFVSLVLCSDSAGPVTLSVFTVNPDSPSSQAWWESPFTSEKLDAMWGRGKGKAKAEPQTRIKLIKDAFEEGSLACIEATKDDRSALTVCRQYKSLRTCL